ncbi:MAG: hydantoinase/oxoprolinase family protein [Candidatus Sulfotelmatobacter sp.]
MRIAIDTGGTFTDCVYVQDSIVRVLKLLSTPADPEKAVLQAVRQASPATTPEVRHGTTVGTNILLERKGSRVAFVTTAGFEDTIAIGRQARTNLYNWSPPVPPPLVPDELRFGINERTAPDGSILVHPSDAELSDLCTCIQASGAESIAISLLFSFANPQNEQRVARTLVPLGLPISVSHVVLPEFREYERAATVAVNAYLAPKVGRYIHELDGAVGNAYENGRVQVMQSNGGIISARLAAEQPVRTVLSGPAGGVIGAYHVARIAGFENIISFDMGGTSTDVALVTSNENGPAITGESVVSQIPLSVPMLDIHTVGAGGGSLAHFDSGGIVRVGPESAGADPGPICYGRGTQPTVTDANLMLGRLDPELFLGGDVRLDEARTRKYMEDARQSIASVEQFAAGILLLAESTMEKALRVISVERGYDPRDFTLVAFGGAGPLHACSLARALRIPRVLVPQMPGALSAFGILLADATRDYSKTVMSRPDHKLLDPPFNDLTDHGLRELHSEGLTGDVTHSVDLRYAGQGYELNVPYDSEMLPSFHRAHQRRYGYADESRIVEVVNIRVRITARTERVELPQAAARHGNGSQAILKTWRMLFDQRAFEAPVYDRSLLVPGDEFSGPAVVAEYSATTVIPPEFAARVDAFNNIVINHLASNNIDSQKEHYR